MNNTLDVTNVNIAMSTVEQKENQTYKDSDPEWSDYVLSLLTKDEMINDRPKTDGLCRLAKLIYGDISFDLKVHYVGDNGAAVTCFASYFNNLNICVTKHGSAECNHENTDSPYNKYPLASAETRAIGRAIKRILNLNNVITAEESSKTGELTQIIKDEGADNNITDTQIKFINRMCEKLNIDVKTVVDSVVGNHKVIDDVSHTEALKINEFLDEYSRNPKEGFGTYNLNWKLEFKR